MPNINELRNRLALAQSLKTTIRLSNSQCIDILLKVCKKNSIQLVPSNDGVLFYTINEVKSEVENELIARGGRVASYELSAVLNVQPDYVDMAIDDILNSSDFYIKSSQGLVLSKKYLSDLMCSINDRIQECGFVDLTNLSLEYDLPVDLIRSHVNGSIGTVIDGSINGNVIESSTFEKRKVNNIKAALLAVTVPILTRDISRLANININMVNDVISDLIKSGSIKGMLRNGEYVPHCYTNSVENFILSNYNRSGYIEVKDIKKFDFVSEKSIKNLCKDAIKLDTVFINKNLFEPVSILINEAISSKSWRDLTSMLPTILTHSDWMVIMNNVKNSTKNGFLMESVYVSNEFVQDLIQYIIEYITSSLAKPETVHEGEEGTEGEGKEIKSPKKTPASEDGIEINGDVLKLPIDDVVLYNTVNDILSRNVKNHFYELFLLYPEGLYSHVREQLVKDLTSYVSLMNKHVNAKLHVQDKTEILKKYVMQSELTIRAFEKIKGDLTSVILQNLVREVCVLIFNILLEMYLRSNKISDDEVTSNNRISLVGLILDDEIKDLFNNYIGGIKKKCITTCSDCYKELCKALYINYNIKRDSRQFLKDETLALNKQLNAITNLDHYPCLRIAINLILLKNNQYIFINDKNWCINESFKLFKPLLETSACYETINELITLLSEEGNKDVKLQELTTVLINHFRH